MKKHTLYLTWSLLLLLFGCTDDQFEAFDGYSIELIDGDETHYGATNQMILNKYRVVVKDNNGDTLNNAPANLRVMFVPKNGSRVSNARNNDAVTNILNQDISNQGIAHAYWFGGNKTGTQELMVTLGITPTGNDERTDVIPIPDKYVTPQYFHAEILIKDTAILTYDPVLSVPPQQHIITAYGKGPIKQAWMVTDVSIPIGSIQYAGICPQNTPPEICNNGAVYPKEVIGNICPQGWRVPSPEEIVDLGGSMLPFGANKAYTFNQAPFYREQHVDSYGLINDQGNIEWHGFDKQYYWTDRYDENNIRRVIIINDNLLDQLTPIKEGELFCLKCVKDL